MTHVPTTIPAFKREEAERLLEKLPHEPFGDNREIMVCKIFLLLSNNGWQLPYIHEAMAKKVHDRDADGPKWIETFCPEPVQTMGLFPSCVLLDNE